MYCPNCRHKVTRRSKFCPNCGEDLITARQAVARPAPVQRGVPLPVAFGLLVVGILLGFLYFQYAGPSTRSTPPAIGSLPGIQSAAVLDIAKEFMCPCGSCSDALDVCDCTHKNGAVEIKTFIARKLAEGHLKPHIVEMVQQTYGGLKSTTLPLPENLKPQLPMK